MTEQVQWADDVEPDLPASGSPSRFDETLEPVPFGIEQGDRLRHLYVVGKTGTGKTTFRRNLILQYIEEGRGFSLLDPLGDLADVLETSSATMGVVSFDALTLVFDDPEDVFSSVDAQSDRHQRIENIVQHIRKALALEDRGRIANRIEVLEEARLEELDYGDLPLSPKSLEAFVSFLEREPGLKYPILTLSPDGFVFAEWEAAPNRYFAVEFLGTNDNVRFVIFSPNPRHPDKRVSLSGSATVDTLMIVAEPRGVRSWAGMEDE